ncbi:two-component regulator propeller domain-containing protein, partial [Bacteroidota bacterium]
VFGVGFYKFNGTTWTNYNIETHPELPSNFFHNVSAAPDNVIYLSTWGKGFTRLKNNQFETFDAYNTDLIGIPDATNFLVIYDVKEDSKQNAWIMNFWAANSKTISVLTADSSWYHYEFGSPLFPQTVQTGPMVIDQFDTKWFVVSTGSRGLYYFNENGTFNNTEDDTWGVLKASSGLNSDIIYALAVDKRGELWVGTSLGVNIITDPSRPNDRKYSVFGLRQQTINCISVDPLNRKWVGTRQGVFVMTPDGSSLLDQYDSRNSPLPTDDIKCIAIDEITGMVYIGTDFGLSTLTTESMKANDTYDELFVYPNPYIINNSSNSATLSIDGLIENSQIKVITISGKLINEFEAPGGRIAFWDGRDQDGKLVPSGIYIVIAYDQEVNNISSTKVAVIRQ